MKTQPILILLILATAGHARAQFTLDWSTADAGGGECSGGAYSLRGTIAQTDAAAPASGGTLSLDGGYWTFPDASPPLPELVIRLDSGFVILNWQETDTAVVLESSTDLQLWLPVDPQPVTNVWAAPQSERGFFRLSPAP